MASADDFGPFSSTPSPTSSSAGGEVRDGEMSHSGASRDEGVGVEIGEERSRVGDSRMNFITKEFASIWGLLTDDMTSRSTVEPTMEIMEYLACIHVYGVSSVDLRDFIRILFHIEEAWRYYEDNFMAIYPCLKQLQLKEFTKRMFMSCDLLLPYVADFEIIYKCFNDYKLHIPIFGAAILNETYEKCLLVQERGGLWGFPKGMRAKDENEYQCAIRKVKEEVGLDISNSLKRDLTIGSDYGGKITRLFIITDVREETEFATTTKNQIREIRWYHVDELSNMLFDNERILSSRLKGWITRNARSAAHMTSRGERTDMT